MRRTETIVLVSAGGITTLGFLLGINWHMSALYAALMLLNLFTLLLLLRQRRSVAILRQELRMLRKEVASSEQLTSYSRTENQEAFKKILGVLQAQQTSTEILRQEIRSSNS